MGTIPDKTRNRTPKTVVVYFAIIQRHLDNTYKDFICNDFTYNINKWDIS